MSNDPWFSIGHTTYPEQRSGCTVIVFDRHVPVAADLRGGGPGTREISLLEPGSVGMLDAIVLSGGSAYGLQASDGVMRFLAEHGRGFTTRAGPVPLVASAIIYDLLAGEPYHPTPEDGYAAAKSAVVGGFHSGRLGAGTGATVAKLGGSAIPSGMGFAEVTVGDVTISVVVVLNAAGDVRDPETGEWLAGGTGRDIAISTMSSAHQGENTTIGAVMIGAPMDRRSLERAAVSAQAAMARCTVPAHTIVDGDIFFAAASSLGSMSAQETLAITSAVEVCVEQAIVSIFR